MAQIVLLSGSCDGRTTISSEKADGVHAAAPGTSAYWLVPLNVTAVSGSPVRSPLTPRCGDPTNVPFATPCWSTSAAAHAAEAPVRARRVAADGRRVDRGAV